MSKEYSLRMKDFNGWNLFKKKLELKDGREAHAYVREVWWCALGINVGVEIDGKHENFERPVLILKVYNKDSLFVLPITSKEKEDEFHVSISSKVGKVRVKITQGKVISSKRLLRKIDTVSTSDFLQVKARFIISLL
ncbi:MAG: hypothetical protein JWN64_668 [Parcubacteria group bacterium]|nr:hypothetical protein [Parcubacteria group bacterium]